MRDDIPTMAEIIEHNDREREVGRRLMEKNVIRPMVDKLIESGAISKPDEPYKVEWTDNGMEAELTEKDKATLLQHGPFELADIEAMIDAASKKQCYGPYSLTDLRTGKTYYHGAWLKVRAWLYDVKMRVLGWLHICQCCQRSRAKWVEGPEVTGWLCEECLCEMFGNRVDDDA